ncbi:Uncharacterized protein TCM_027836 [Theobroma cacao]|uniref:Uncharacterized protein n=1 Tax=Theobroma cacao TaxID=3641 RepID=A0A061G902_THECC|nr:Uncharacterized protein TCM_027836 [Theobroma cacao]
MIFCCFYFEVKPLERTSLLDMVLYSPIILLCAYYSNLRKSFVACCVAQTWARKNDELEYQRLFEVH